MYQLFRGCDNILTCMIISFNFFNYRCNNFDWKYFSFWFYYEGILFGKLYLLNFVCLWALSWFTFRFFSHWCEKLISSIFLNSEKQFRLAVWRQLLLKLWAYSNECNVSFNSSTCRLRNNFCLWSRWFYLFI